MPGLISSYQESVPGLPVEGSGQLVLIREATAADVQSVRELSTASGRGSWSAGVFTAAPDRVVLVAEMTGELVGAAKTHIHERADGDVPAGHYLGGVIVDPVYRRQGIGAALTRARMEWIGSHADAAFYFANEHNTASIRLHEAFGFRPLGRFAAIHGVTADDGRSELILHRAPIDGSQRS